MSKQLRYLVSCALNKAISVKQPNGYMLETFELVDEYQVQIQELDDEISVSIYGAGITNLLRLSSVRNTLENFLKDKLNDTSDNITKYSIVLGNKRYKILSVKNGWLDIQFSNMVENG